MEESRQESWSEYLDKEMKNKLFVRFVFDPNFKEVEEFAVIYLMIIDNKPCEVIRYDCNKNEAVNVHYFYHKNPEKRYLDKEKSFSTLEEFIEDIKKNWRNYQIKYFEKKDIFI
ncbi:MAG: hypothetical protein COT15_04410 [Candidatus Diapherotrites archaeon CG08_land_8_20_14_0_20_34_12]|nr:MAG: hypothetical protein COT15_04410 [Candidatus Diapherotrites archaeon CG08_land_8_20_14_0_20_34_12]